MKVESTYTFTGEELSELLMTAWANGWTNEDKTDDGKRKYTFEILQSFHWKNSGIVVGREDK